MGRGAQAGAVARGLAGDVNSLAGIGGSVVFVAGAVAAGVQWNAAASAAVVFGGLAVLLFWRCVQLEGRVAELMSQTKDIQAATDAAVDNHMARRAEWLQAVADQRQGDVIQQRQADLAELRAIAEGGGGTIPTLDAAGLVAWSQTVWSLFHRLNLPGPFDPWPPLLNRGAEADADDATVAAWREGCIAYLPTLTETIGRLDAD